MQFRKKRRDRQKWVELYGKNVEENTHTHTHTQCSDMHSLKAGLQ